MSEDLVEGGFAHLTARVEVLDEHVDVGSDALLESGVEALGCGEVDFGVRRAERLHVSLHQVRQVAQTQLFV